MLGGIKSHVQGPLAGVLQSKFSNLSPLDSKVHVLSTPSITHKALSGAVEDARRGKAGSIYGSLLRYKRGEFFSKRKKILLLYKEKNLIR